MVDESEENDVVMMAEEEEQDGSIISALESTSATTERNTTKSEHEHDSEPEKIHMDQGETTLIADSLLDKDSDSVPFEKASEIPEPSARDREEQYLEGEVLFDPSITANYTGWDNLRWMSYSGARRVKFCRKVYKLFEERKQQLFWSNVDQKYIPRMLAIYEEPSLIIVLRRPENTDEILKLLDVADFTDFGDHLPSILSYWIAESVIDPAMSKLQLSALTTPTAVPEEGWDARRRSCFEIVTPSEKILLSAVDARSNVRREERSFSDSVAFLETSATELAIIQVLYGAHYDTEGHGSLPSDGSWMHQIVLGTLHAHVLSGNLQLLHRVLSSIKAAHEADDDQLKTILSQIVNALDDAGKTPLFYACTRRMPLIVASLVSWGARVDLDKTTEGRTLLHICSANLDDKSLSSVLAVSTPHRLDPNAVDKHGITPMYLAITEGTSNGGVRDSAALGRCIQALKAWGGRVSFSLAPDMLHPVSYLSKHWYWEDLNVLFENINFRYPLKDDNSIESVTQISLSAMYQYPVHAAILNFLDRIQQADDRLRIGDLLETLKILFSHGFEPNERLDVIKADFQLSKTYSTLIGFAPIQIVALSALKLEQNRLELDDFLVQKFMNYISDISECLVRHGARLSLDAPPQRRLRRTSSELAPVIDSENFSLGHSVNKGDLKLDINNQALALLGDKEKLKNAMQHWNNLTAPHVSDLVFSKDPDDKSIILESEAPGGSSERSCAICWKPFGTLKNRKHRCRMSLRYVCDECSSKRVAVGTKEYRISDGQFLLAVEDASRGKAEAERAIEIRRGKSVETARSTRLETEENANRESLFGEVFEQAASYVFGHDDKEKSNTRSVESMTSSLSETRDALLERGQKLSSLEEKTSRMVDASADFARMAKELRTKSERGMFW